MHTLPPTTSQHARAKVWYGTQQRAPFPQDGRAGLADILGEFQKPAWLPRSQQHRRAEQCSLLPSPTNTSYTSREGGGLPLWSDRGGGPWDELLVGVHPPTPTHSPGPSQTNHTHTPNQCRRNTLNLHLDPCP